MTDDRTLPEDFAALAGEYALGLLVGPELARARGLVRGDSAFREAVQRWRGQLASLLDEIEPVAPPAAVWTRIDTAMGAGSAPDNVQQLNRKVVLWRGLAGAMTALAASLALFMLLRPPLTAPAPAPPPGPAPAPAPAPAPPPAPPPSPPPAPEPSLRPMVARLVADEQVALVAAWDKQRSHLLLAKAAGLPVAKTRSHELWVIPVGGKPRSLGVLPESGEAFLTIPASSGRLLLAGATLAVSVEPRGGSPTGAPTGPVVASGPLKAA